jgi:hypothetical protein
VGIGDDGPVLPRDHPLAGCEAKFWRAHNHFEILQDEIGAVYGTGEVQFMALRGELKPDTENVFRYVIGDVIDPDLRFATMIGDIVHNLRSALDHLVFELAFLGTRGKVIPGKVAYPASETRANWNSSHVQKVMPKGVLKKHRTMIYRTQPCYRRNDAAADAAVRRRRPRPLADLDKLWNHDKHRMLQPVHITPLNMHFRVAEIRDCEITGQPRLSRQVFGTPLEKDTELLTIPIRKTGIDPYVGVDFDGEGEISFRNRLPVRDGLAGIGTAVETILAWFTPEFETPAARKLWGLSRQGWIETTPPRRAPRVWVSGEDPDALRPASIRPAHWETPGSRQGSPS